MDVQRFKEEVQRVFSGKILVQEPMARHTSWKIGGPVDLLLIPESEDDCITVLQLAKHHGVPYWVIGNGSNLLVTDKGIRGLVIKIGSNMNSVTLQDQEIIAQSGAMMPIVARIAADHALVGLEFAAGIPATVGGALVMNAGAHGRCMADVVKEVTILDSDGIQHRIGNAEMLFRYRSSRLKTEQGIVMQVVFSLDKGSASDIKVNMLNFMEQRRKAQPSNKPNAGSVFKNPPGTSAGQLIDAAGCKGMRCGGAEVSTKHANFILNTDHATAADVLQLVERVKAAVIQKFNIELELEVRVVGE